MGKAIVKWHVICPVVELRDTILESAKRSHCAIGMQHLTIAGHSETPGVTGVFQQSAAAIVHRSSW